MPLAPLQPVGRRSGDSHDSRDTRCASRGRLYAPHLRAAGALHHLYSRPGGPPRQPVLLLPSRWHCTLCGLLYLFPLNVEFTPVSSLKHRSTGCPYVQDGEDGKPGAHGRRVRESMCVLRDCHPPHPTNDSSRDHFTPHLRNIPHSPTQPQPLWRVGPKIALQAAAPDVALRALLGLLPDETRHMYAPCRCTRILPQVYRKRACSVCSVRLACVCATASQSLGHGS